MLGENSSEKPKNYLGDAIPQEALEGMREVAKGNLKGQLETKISDDLEALTLAEKDTAFKDSAEIQQIKKGLEATLEKIKALENPSEAEVVSLESERETLSNRLSETTQKIESQELTSSVTPSAETEPPATLQPSKEKRPIIVRGTINEELAKKIEAETKDKQVEQLSLALERLADQKSKLESILAKPDLSASKKGLVGRAIEETSRLSEGGAINQNSVERLWARIEKNFDIISAGINEITIPPEDLPIVSSPEGEHMTQELEQRLREAKEPAEKMDLDLGEKKELSRFEVSEEATKLIEEMEQIKDKLDKILLEDFDIPSELAEQLNNSQRRLDGLIEFLAKDNRQPLLDKSHEEIRLAQKTIEKYKTQSTPEIKMEDLDKQIPSTSINTAEKKSDSYPNLFEITPEEEKAKATEIAKQLFRLHQELSRNKKDEDTFSLSDEIAKKADELVPDNDELRLQALTELVSMLNDHEFERDQVAIENIEANESTEGEIPKELLSTPEAGPTPAEAELISKVKTIEDVEELPEAVKEKIGKGFETWGLRVDAFKDKQWSNLFRGISKLRTEGSDENRLFVNIQNSFLRSRERSKEKLENISDGKVAKATSAASLAGNVLRYGRGIMDATGLSVVNPLRWVTWGSMALSRLGEGIKEVAVEKSSAGRRLDEEEALAQAIKIYEKAGGTYNIKAGGDEKTTRTALKTAYYQDVPKDLIRRLESATPDEKRTTLQKFGESLMTFRMEKSITNTQKKLEEIEKSSLTEEEKEQKRTEVVKKYETLLRDYDRIINENGQIDMVAMFGKRMESIGKYAATAMTLETLAELPFAVEKMWDHAATILSNSDVPNHENLTPEQIEKANAFYDSAIGVNSKDGISNEEAVKIAGLVESLKTNGRLDDADLLEKHYANLLESSTDSNAEIPPTGLTKTEVEENIKTINNLKTSDPERAKGLLEFYANSKIEGSKLSFKELIDHPEKLQDIKTGSASVTETVKPFRFENPIAGNQDSIQFSTEQSFRMNPDHFGYNVAKDGTISEWAKHKTTETLKELADKKFGGKIPDLVHDGDKIIVEMGADGKPHVNFENSSGLPTGNLPEKIGIAKPETQSIEKIWKEAPTDSRDDIVRQFIIKEMATPEYQAGDFPKLNPEKLNTYSKMFNGEWDKINNPEKLAQSLFEFDNRIKEYTAMVLGGKFDKVTDPTTLQQLKANIFPVEGKSGKLFFTQFVDEGKWQLFQEDNKGITQQLEHKKSLFGGKTKVFDTMHVRKFLRSH